jgi:hypothetical protein
MLISSVAIMILTAIHLILVILSNNIYYKYKDLATKI